MELDLDHDIEAKLDFIIVQRQKSENYQTCVENLIRESAAFLKCEPCPDFDRCNVEVGCIDSQCYRCPKCFADLSVPRNQSDGCKICSWKPPKSSPALEYPSFLTQREPTFDARSRTEQARNTKPEGR